MELPPTTNRFDLDTITDVVLTIQYTARPGARPPSTPHLPAGQLFTVRHQFPAAWASFIAAGADDGELTINLGHEHLPFALRGRSTSISELWLMTAVRPGPALSVAVGSPQETLRLSAPATPAPTGTDGLAEGVSLRSFELDTPARIAPGRTATITFTGLPDQLAVAPAVLDDLLLRVRFTT